MKLEQGQKEITFAQRCELSKKFQQAVILSDGSVHGFQNPKGNHKSHAAKQFSARNPGSTLITL